MQATLSSPIACSVVRFDREERRPRPRIENPEPRPVGEPVLRPEAGDSLQRWLDLCG
jgi:hypothetical protein